MRLGQLARKLERTPAEIIEFLASKNVRIDEGVNSKLDSSHIALLLQEYAPGTQAENIQIVDDTSIEIPASTPSSEVGESKENVSQESTPEVEASQGEQGDVIRAPKVELAGLKVLGKIDLPEPKKKQPEAPQENAETQPAREIKRDRRNQDFKKSKRPSKNPVALQREQEAQAAKRKHEEDLRLQKERRTQNYLKRVKSHQPTKAARLVKEEAEQLSAKELEESPKTWWGKFVKWFTT